MGAKGDETNINSPFGGLGGNTQNALGFAIPPFLPFRNMVRVQHSDLVDASAEMQAALAAGLVENTNWIAPLTFKLDGELDFRFPFDPIISLSSKNIITRRYVNKSGMRGSIKEHWSQDDWEITIQGVMIQEDETLRNVKMTQLRQYLNHAGSINVVCDVLNGLDIYRIAVESYDFPFTKGVENQTFVIKGYSDSDYDLLIAP